MFGIKGIVRWIVLLVIVIVVAIIVLVVLFIPKVPTVAFMGTTNRHLNISLSSDYVSVDSIVQIDNQNYLAIQIVSLVGNITYHGNSLGLAQQSGINLPGRTPTNITIPAQFSVTDPNIAQAIFSDSQANGGFTVDMNAVAQIQVLSFKFSKTLSFSQFIDTKDANS